MPVLQLMRWFLFSAEVLIAAPILYLCILSICAIWRCRGGVGYTCGQGSDTPVEADSSCPSPIYRPLRVYKQSEKRPSFAILLPAHNEEIMLCTLLQSLSQLTYPKDCYTVCVVADNCTDSTAELARAAGRVRVYERFNQSERGKGYALNWLLQRLEEDELVYDAYLVLDADSIVVPTFLQSMERELAKGAQALQACNTVLNTSDSPSTALRWVALTLINHVRPLGRNALGASSTLTGNGMCLSRALLTRYPWRAFSVAEDYQYYLMLIEQGERVYYVPDAVVRSHMPTTFAQMRTQDLRWEGSDTAQTKWHSVLRLLRVGIRCHDFVRIEAVVELLTPPLSFLVGSSLLTCAAALLLGSLPSLLLSLILISGLTCYISTALYLLRPPHSVYRAFLHAPGFMIWKLWVYLVLSRSKKHAGQWIRTSRV